MIVFVDIETSGLDPNYHEPIEVGLVAAEYRREMSSVEFSLAFDPVKADPKALEVNGWSYREFAPVFSVEDAHASLMDHFADGALFCAWHSHFDEAFLAAWCRRNSLEIPWSHRAVVDLPSLVMARCGVVVRGSTRTLAKQLGLDPDYDGRHSALGDAGFAYDVFCQLELYEVIG